MIKVILLGSMAVLGALAQNPPSGTPAPPKGSISGVVTDTGGVPLPDVGVMAICLSCASKQASGATDSQGHYAFQALEPGQYHLAAAPLLLQSERSAPGPETVRTVTLNAGQDLKLDFRVVRYGEITGKVVDENKEPVPNTPVILAMREYVLGALRFRYGGMAQTDDRGVYTLQRVLSGRPYLVMAGHRLKRLDPVSDVPADPKMRKRVAMRTYFPDSPTADGGELLVLRPGERREGVDVRLRKSQSYCIDGVLEADGKPGALNFTLTEPGPASGVTAVGASYIVGPAGKTGTDGKIRICDLYPGTYGIRASQDPSGNSDVPGFMGTTEVTIKDEDLHNLRVQTTPRMAVPVRVVWDGPAPEKPVDGKIMLTLRPMTRTPWRGEVAMPEVSIPGEFVFPNLFMDEYQVLMMRVPPGLYVKDAIYGGASALHEPMRVGSALDGGLRIVMGRDGGTVSVKVADKDANPVPDISVYLVPANTASEALVQAVTVTGQTGLDGSYTSGAIARGKYYVLASSLRIDATPESAGRLWRSRSRGKEVELAPNGSAQVTVEPVTIE